MKKKKSDVELEEKSPWSELRANLNRQASNAEAIDAILEFLESTDAVIRKTVEEIIEGE